MKYKPQLSEELSKMHFLSGINEIYLNEEKSTEEELEFEDKTEELNSELEKEI